MKIKRILSLILAIVICATMFAVLPTVSAADASLWENWKEDGTRKTDTHTAPEGYEHIVLGDTSSHRKYSLVTKEQYNLSETTIVLRDVYIRAATNGAYWGNMVFSNARENAASLSYSSTSTGTLSLLLRDIGETIKVITYTSSGEKSLVQVPESEEYRINFLKENGSWYMYINDTSFTNEYVNALCNNGDSYITTASNNKFCASVKFVNKYHTSYDMLENTLVIDDSSLRSITDWNYINFSTDIVKEYSDDITNYTTNNVGFFMTPVTVNGTKKVKLSFTADKAEDLLISQASKYKIRFRRMGGDIFIFVNSTIIRNTSTGNALAFYKALKAYYENGNLKRTFISALSDDSTKVALDVVPNSDFQGDWLTSKGSNAVSSGTIKLNLEKGAISASRMNLLTGKLTLKNTTFSSGRYSDGSRYNFNFISFGDVGITSNTSYDADTKKIISLYLEPAVVEDKVIKSLNVYYKNKDGNRVQLAVIKAATDYTFEFEKEDDNYILYINNRRIKSSALNTLGELGVFEKCYVSLATEHTFNTTPEYTAKTGNEGDETYVYDPVYRCLDFGDYTIEEDGATIDGVEYKNGDVFNTSGDHTYIYKPYRKEYTLALYRSGDLNTDNNVNINDLVAMKKYMSGSKELTLSEVKAADVTFDNEVRSDDLVEFRKDLLGVNDFVDTETDPEGKIQAVSPANNQNITLANDEVYYWYQNYTLNSSANYTRSADIYQNKNTVFEWNSVEGATGYVLKIATNEALENAVEIETEENTAEICDLFVGTKYYWQVIAKFENEEVIASNVFAFNTVNSPRTIYLDGVSNTRDIGGYMTESGKRVKQGMVYRSAKLDNITAAGLDAALNIYNIKSDLDMRKAGDGQLTGVRSPLGDSVKYIHASGAWYTGGTNGIDKSVNHENIKKAIQAFANPDNFPMVIHCSIGRDRTGTMTMLINGLLGVSKEDILMDYELSFFSYSGSSDLSVVNQMVHQFDKTYNYINDNFEGEKFSDRVEAYLLEIGVSQETIDAIKANLLED